MTPVIVLTPVKNDAWILERFLAVCSKFADHIVIADQFSDDGSRELYGKFPKVVVVNNDSREYNEACRQIDLIKKARLFFPGKKIILTLDADEILVANFKETKSWHEMMKAPVGTVLYFEKPDLYGSTRKAIRYDADYPMGMVEDYSADCDIFYLLRGFGSRSYKMLDQNNQLTFRDLASFEKLQLEDPLFLHYAHTRLDIQRSKLRHYMALEAGIYGNSFKTRLMRRHKYFPERFYHNKIVDSPGEWFEGWERQGIDMHTVDGEQGLYWRDIEVLKLFAKRGAGFFRYENIWDADWEGIRKKAIAEGVSGIPNAQIKRPSAIIRTGEIFYYQIYLLYRRLKGGR